MILLSANIILRTNPVDNVRLTSYYGDRSGGFHRGVDIGASVAGVSGDNVYATQEGTVKVVANSTSYGNYVIIEHTAYGFCTLYAHLQSYVVEIDQWVNAGRRIGYMGHTGHVIPPSSAGTHLHFEIRPSLYGISTSAVNPLSYLKLTSQNIVSAGTTDINGNILTDFVQPDFPYTDYAVDAKEIQTYDKMFGRKYRIIVSDDSGNAYDVSDLHVIFKAKKTMLAEYYISNIFLYNLNVDTENKIIQYGTKITIEAGYEGMYYGVIFEGDIVQTIRSKEEGTDYLLEIIAVDSERYLSSGFLNYNIKRGQTMREAVGIIATKSSTTAGLGNISDSFSESKYTRGKAVFGQARDYLKQLAKTQNATFYMNDGQINLVKVTDVPEGTIIKLDYDSGMIGVPTQTEYGMEVKCLLNPQLKCNILVQVQKEDIIERQFQPGSIQYNNIEQDGIYRIIEITYSGDNRGQDWYCELTTIIQSGAFPNMLADPGFSAL